MSDKTYMFPPINLLKSSYKQNIDTDMVKTMALIISQTLYSFSVRIKIIDINVGVRFTRYEIRPAMGVRIKDITKHENEIRIATAARSIHIEAPIQGKATIGIDLPNPQISVVGLREMVESDVFQKYASNLAVAVGREMYSDIVVYDIAQMPHLLIAGTTGSGKTTCIDSIIMSVLYKATPNDIKMVMIDTKAVNMSLYNGIPHLMIPVVTDIRKAYTALNWCVTEMVDRYKKFSNINVKDLSGYNKSAEMKNIGFDGEPLRKLPQILVIIDDLYDLMMSNFNGVQESIVRLAQVARATGIHLVISTQRPSTDVITGLIKANIPSRIAFSTVSAIDSRVILDESGAEKLLGNGDMLFKPQGYLKPIRIQGTYVSESEISDVVDFLKNQMLENSMYNDDIGNKIRTMQSQTKQSTNYGEFDIYFAEAGHFVIEKGKASIGMLQRVFKIGFNRAAKIVDELEKMGVVDAEDGTKPREILMTMEEFENLIEKLL